MKSSTKQKNVFILIAIIALVVLVGGWYYLNTQAASVEIVSENDFYFEIETPEVSINLLNAKDASSGKVKISYNDEFLTILENNTSEGVTTSQLNDTVSYELSKEYFDSNSDTIATLKFDVAKQGVANLTVDENSTLNIKGEDVVIEKVKDLELTLGVIPVREEGNSVDSEGLGSI